MKKILSFSIDEQLAKKLKKYSYFKSTIVETLLEIFFSKTDENYLRTLEDKENIKKYIKNVLNTKIKESELKESAKKEKKSSINISKYKDFL